MPRFTPAAALFWAFFSLFASMASAQISKERDINEDAMAKADVRLFALGNSYTFYWDVPGLVQRFAAEAPLKKKVYAHRMAWGGRNLESYWKLFTPKDGKPLNAELANLLDPRWDVIMLQPWKEDVENDIKTYAPKIIAKIREKNPKARILLYLWEDGPDPTKRQRAYEEVAKQTGALIVPAGWGWVRGKKEKPDWVWTAPDGWHPGYRRAYIAAAAAYATIFERSPVGLKMRSWEHWVQDGGKIALSDDEATYLQTLAWDAVREHGNVPALRGKR
jgi:hypothetical protein